MVQLGNREEYDKITSLNKETWENKHVFREDDCPFCIIEAHQDYILWEWKYWKIIYNKYPYSWDEKHLMAVPRAHKAFSSDLSAEELLELHEVYGEIRRLYGSENYFSCTRETMANRSIEHLHIHFLPGKLQGKYLRKMLENQGFPIQEEGLEMKVCN